MFRIILAFLALLFGCQTTTEQTLSIIKPDAVEKGYVEQIQQRFIDNGLKIVQQKEMQLTQEQAEQFYAVHKERPFYPSLVEYMTSGPIVVMILEGTDAVQKNRDIMGATNPENAAPGTIRADFGTNVQENAVHGSDSNENAKIEIDFFFKL